MFLKHGAKINMNSPLVDAVAHNLSMDIIKTLVDGGVNVN